VPETHDLGDGGASLQDGGGGDWGAVVGTVDDAISGIKGESAGLGSSDDGGSSELTKLLLSGKGGGTIAGELALELVAADTDTSAEVSTINNTISGIHGERSGLSRGGHAVAEELLLRGVRHGGLGVLGFLDELLNRGFLDVLLNRGLLDVLLNRGFLDVLLNRGLLNVLLNRGLLNVLLDGSLLLSDLNSGGRVVDNTGGRGGPDNLLGLGVA